MSDWDSLFYPGTDVLRNKLGIRDAEELKKAETEFVLQRTGEGSPPGNFDLAHLQAIHRHLFQDVYEWAGELRQVDMFKNAPGEYMPHDRIEGGIHYVHGLAVKADFLRNTDVWEFSDKAAQIVGDINHAHPFREGNTRTQLQYLQQLGEQAGHNVDLTKIDRDAWNEAKIRAGLGSYGYMNDQIRAAIVPTLEKAQPIAEKGVEQATKDEERRCAMEIQIQSEAQKQALKDIMAAAERAGKEAAEREAIRRDIEEKFREEQAALLRAQRGRTERLELQRRELLSGRDR